MAKANYSRDNVMPPSPTHNNRPGHPSTAYMNKGTVVSSIFFWQNDNYCPAPPNTYKIPTLCSTFTWKFPPTTATTTKTPPPWPEEKREKGEKLFSFRYVQQKKNNKKNFFS
jgi:hypothetical protein